MNNQKLNYLFIGLVIFAIGLVLVWYFYFSIYEIKIVVQPKRLTINSQEVSQIKIIPLNLLGKSVPFRKVPFTYSIIQNKKLVTISKSRTGNNLLTVSSKNNTGVVKIEITSQYSLFPNIISLGIIGGDSLKHNTN